MNATELRETLRAGLKSALRSRDRVATQALRSALAAIDNAEAVPTNTRAGAIEAAATGVGSTEAARHRLSPEDLADILRREIEERRAAAEEYAAAPDTAARLHAEAEVIAAYTRDVG